ncbi:hypothetical protein R69927_07753 [Paraburkholderia domus]|nr:hypothetical protein R69927_07753 [Paraburkholderia domus]CAE6970363.1 hypothetical protein R70199_08184 [Paraburkholderia domus]
MSAPLRRGFLYASDEGASPTVACLAPGTMMQAIEITLAFVALCLDNFLVNALQKTSPQWLSRMRTILLGTSFALTSVIGVSFASHANACSFALQYGGKMGRSVTALSNVDLLKLADLLATVRDSAAREGPVAIYGFADERDRDASVLARRRAESVSGYLQSLGVAPQHINIDTKIWRATSPAPLGERNQIKVEFEPACGLTGSDSPCGGTTPEQ